MHTYNNNLIIIIISKLIILNYSIHIHGKKRKIISELIYEYNTLSIYTEKYLFYLF